MSTIEQPARRPRQERRTLRGLEVEHEIAVQEGRDWTARKAREQARALAMRTGQCVPMWCYDGEWR